MWHYIDSQRLLRYVTITTSTFNSLKSFPFLRRNALRNGVILILSGQKPCTRIISSILHPFFTVFEDEKLQRKGCYGSSPTKQTSKALRRNPSGN